MSNPSKQRSRGILVVRLGAMGDILHTLPAVRALKLGQPNTSLTWVVEPKWAPLLEQNPFVDRVVRLDRTSLAGLWSSRRELRRSGYRIAVDFQGLLKSALVTAAARADEVYGFDTGELRERFAAIFYHRQILTRSAHVVDRNLELASAAGAHIEGTPCFPLPPGAPEGNLPAGRFVLASPLAGWASKQWPMEHYLRLAGRLQSDLGIPLVLNGAPGALAGGMAPAMPHFCGLSGLIHATRRATAVVGVDSGPLHLAAALEKPGVAIFGPTDPARNGPYGKSLHVLRSSAAVTTYKRGNSIAQSMQDISPDHVFELLRDAVGGRS